MSFEQSQFGPIGGENLIAPSLWSYRTPDSINDVVSSGYFNDKYYQIEDGDYLFVTASDSQAFATLTKDASNVIVTVIEGTAGVELVWPPFNDITDDYEITKTVECLAVDCTDGDVTITLPALRGGNFNIKKIDASLNVIIIDASANGSTLDGAATRNITTRYDNLTINARTSEWARQ